MHTAQHIVENCLKGDLMKGRTVILVTHHISLCLPIASYLVELSGGRVIRQGTISELQASGQLKTVIEVEDEPSEDTMLGGAGLETSNEADATDLNETHWSKKSILRGKLVEAEHRAEGRVSIATYMSYGEIFFNYCCCRACSWVCSAGSGLVLLGSNHHVDDLDPPYFGCE